MYDACHSLVYLVEKFVGSVNDRGVFIPLTSVAPPSSTGESTELSAPQARTEYRVTYTIVEVLQRLSECGVSPDAPAECIDGSIYGKGKEEEMEAIQRKEQAMRFVVHSLLVELNRHCVSIGSVAPSEDLSPLSPLSCDTETNERQDLNLSSRIARGIGPRANFICFVGLSVFDQLAKEAEAREETSYFRECGVRTTAWRRRERQLAEYFESYIQQSTSSPDDVSIDDLSFLHNDADFVRGCLAAFRGAEGELESSIGPKSTMCAELFHQLTLYISKRLTRPFPSPLLSTNPDIFLSLSNDGLSQESTKTLLRLIRSLLFPFEPFSSGHHAFTSVVAVVSLLGEKLLSPLRRRIQSASKNLHPKSNEEVYEDLRPLFLESMITAISSVQVLPTTSRTLEVEGEEGASGVAGFWWTMQGPSLSGKGRSIAKWNCLHSPRSFVVVPALAVAATISYSVIHRGCKDSYGASSLLVAPVQKSTDFFLNDLESKFQFSFEGSDKSTVNVSNVFRLSPSALFPANATFLFKNFPEVDDPADGSRCAGFSKLTLEALATRVASLREGLVVFIVQAHVSPETQRVVEGWGTALRTVVLLSSVGEWGLTQLCLRFNVSPNSTATPVASLRFVAAGRVGVRGYAIDEAVIADESGLLTERRQRVIVWVGEAAAAVPAEENTTGDTTDERGVVNACAENANPSSPNPAYDSNPPLNSMYEGADSDSTSSDDRTRESSSNSEESSTRADDEEENPSSEEELPLFPYVLCSVLLGGAAPSLQSAALEQFAYIYRTLLHLFLLPTPSPSSTVNASSSFASFVVDGVPYVECAVVHYLDALIEHNTKLSSNSDLFLAKVLRLLRESVWSYALLSLQQQCGVSGEDAWCRLTEILGTFSRENVESDAGERNKSSSDEGTDENAGLRLESWIEVQSALLTLGRLLDTLIRTTVVGELSSNPTGEKQLFFFPTID